MLAVAEGLDLPEDVATSSNAILAVKRAGKSNAAVVIAEAMTDAGLPWCAIDPKGDWWGVRSDEDGTGPGLPVVIFGGLHGDLPLEAGAGAFVAELIAEQRLTCVLDVSEFSKGEQVKFLTPFAERLLKVNRDPLHLFLEECDEYVPQRVQADEARLVGAIGKLVRRGGFRGIGTTLITQRSAVVNKDVLTQTETLVVLRTTSPQDRKAVEGWLVEHAASKELLESLPGLENGEAWVISPHVLGLTTPQRVQFRRRRTFDSGATPKAGEVRRQPTRLADVDLVGVKEAMAESIERAKANDPKELQREITTLRRQLAEAKADQPVPEVERVEVPVLDRAQIDALVEPLRELEQGVAEIHATITTTAKAVIEHLEHALEITHAAARHLPAAPAPRPAPRPIEHARPAPRSVVRDVPDPADLTPYARHLLEALAKRHPLALTERQWSVAADRSQTSSAWDPAVRLLQRSGLVAVSNGQDWAVTDEGLAVAGVDPGTPPPTGAELITWWQQRITGPSAGAARTALALLHDEGDGITVDELADRAGWSRTSSGPSAAVRILEKLGLARREDGLIVLDEPLRA